MLKNLDSADCDTDGLCACNNGFSGKLLSARQSSRKIRCSYSARDLRAIILQMQRSVLHLRKVLKTGQRASIYPGQRLLAYGQGKLTLAQ